MDIFHLKRKLFSIIFLVIILFPVLVFVECTCDEEEEGRNRTEALKYKIVAIASILVAGAIGVCVPMLGKKFPALSPERDIFFIIKAFAAGVILATGFIHVLPDAFESLTSPCLSDHPWGDFPFTGFVAMCTSMGSLMVDAFATMHFQKSHLKGQVEVADEENVPGHDGHAHVHTHASHGHAHGLDTFGSSELLRHRVISQVLELGIVVHSVIIGISLGASESPETIKPLVAALSFHQFFEGMGLGSCIIQYRNGDLTHNQPNEDGLLTGIGQENWAKFKSKAFTIMALFFSLTTPVGIAIGLGIANIYNESSPTALIVEGIFNAASAGILIYMALVDLLAADFMSPRMQSNCRLQIGANAFLLLGAGFMSLIAKWA
ncbi:hypothetical protein L6164_031670 [Bauhinia variegata]|uniref:Uncharacterized protein n=1 Tax=Bauhinia variegata TaxID=167791 RepID=A0ACB9LFT7_BAUVA|nr:hypothetical protein L6164_031670 [Bauhinia variegata]